VSTGLSEGIFGDAASAAMDVKDYASALGEAVCCRVLQGVAGCCNVLQLM